MVGGRVDGLGIFSKSVEAVSWLDRWYRALMLGAMGLELLLLIYIAWRA
jgi:hypothetical protein